MIDNWLRGGAMAILLAAGSYLLRPAGSEALIDADLRFEECAAEVGLEHTHTMCRLSSRFENIMPWLRSVGRSNKAAPAGRVATRTRPSSTHTT